MEAVQDESVVLTIEWPVAFFIENSHAENAAVLISEGQSSDLRCSLLAFRARNGGIRKALLVM